VVITNEQFCALLTDDLVGCEGIIEGMASTNIVPEAWADLLATDFVTTDPNVVPDIDRPEEIPDGEVGDTQVRDDLEITLVRADWRPDLSDVFFKPKGGNKYVSVLVEYNALEDGATYNIIFWDAEDTEGNRYEATVLGPITPDLKVGSLAQGEGVRGWVTFEVPRDVNDLRVIESQVLKPDVAWNISR
jgi:hypothetical protein